MFNADTVDFPWLTKAISAIIPDPACASLEFVTVHTPVFHRNDFIGRVFTWIFGANATSAILKRALRFYRNPCIGPISKTQTWALPRCGTLPQTLNSAAFSAVVNRTNVDRSQMSSIYFDRRRFITLFTARWSSVARSATSIVSFTLDLGTWQAAVLPRLVTIHYDWQTAASARNPIYRRRPLDRL